MCIYIYIYMCVCERQRDSVCFEGFMDFFSFYLGKQDVCSRESGQGQFHMTFTGGKNPEFNGVHSVMVPAAGTPMFTLLLTTVFTLFGTRVLSSCLLSSLQRPILSRD